MPDLDKATVRVLEAYKAAVLAKDVQAFIRLYDPTVRIFDTWGVWLYDGTSKWEMAVEAWLTSLGAERVKVSFDDVQVTGNADFQVLTAVVTYANISAAGEVLRAMQNRLTWAVKTSGHVLRIVHEHTSAPVGFEDLKAILQRASGG